MTTARGIKIRWWWLVVLAVIIWLSFRLTRPEDQEDQALDEPQETPSRTRQRTDREPTFTADSADSQFLVGSEKEIAVSREETAMRAVYARCSQFAAFREGSKLEGTYVPSEFSKKLGALVNVSVTLARPAAAEGNTLWYQITFSESGQPSHIVANKDVSARLCRLGPADVPVPL